MCTAPQLASLLLLLALLGGSVYGGLHHLHYGQTPADFLPSGSEPGRFLARLADITSQLRDFDNMAELEVTFSHLPLSKRAIDDVKRLTDSIGRYVPHDARHSYSPRRRDEGSHRLRPQQEEQQQQEQRRRRRQRSPQTQRPACERGSLEDSSLASILRLHSLLRPPRGTRRDPDIDMKFFTWLEVMDTFQTFRSSMSSIFSFGRASTSKDVDDVTDTFNAFLDNSEWGGCAASPPAARFSCRLSCRIVSCRLSCRLLLPPFLPHPLATSSLAAFLAASSCRLSCRLLCRTPRSIVVAIASRTAHRTVTASSLRA